MSKKIKDSNNVESEVPETVNDINEAGERNPAAELEEAKKDVPEKKRKKKVLVSGAEFWTFAPETENGDFDGVIFVGKYCGSVVREKDGKDAATNPNEKAGSIIGYDFEQEETGLHFIIGNSHAIQKGLEKAEYSKEALFEIEFLGKGTTANNKPYNRFEVSILE